MARRILYCLYSALRVRRTVAQETRPWRIMLQNRPIMLCRNSLEIALLCLGLT